MTAGSVAYGGTVTWDACLAACQQTPACAQVVWRDGCHPMSVASGEIEAGDNTGWMSAHCINSTLDSSPGFLGKSWFYNRILTPTELFKLYSTGDSEALRPAGLMMELQTCSRLLPEHRQMLRAARTSVQAQGCPVSHPWPFSHGSFCCAKRVPTHLEYLPVHLDSQHAFLCAANGSVGTSTQQLSSMECKTLCNNNSRCSFVSTHVDGGCRLFNSCVLTDESSKGWQTFSRPQQNSCPQGASVSCKIPPCLSTQSSIQLQINIGVNSLYTTSAASVAVDLESRVKQVLTEADGVAVVTHVHEVHSGMAPCTIGLEAVLSRPQQGLEKSFESRGTHAVCCPHDDESFDHHASKIISSIN